jgi:VRR-NUC domain
VPLLRPNVPPPPHYYAANVLRLLAAVDRQYNDILLERERNYLGQLFDLSVDGQRLYARLLTRKGPMIRIDSLGYREVNDLDGALDELQAGGLLTYNPAVPADQLLTLLTRSELEAEFPAVRAARKARQVDVIAAKYPEPYLRQRLAVPYPVCVLLELDRLRIMQLLFFGDARTDLTTFVLEDLGMLRFESYALDPAQRQFRDRADFDDYLNLLARREQLRGLDAQWQHGSATTLLETLSRPHPRRLLERVRSGLLNQLGRSAERAGECALALAAYACSSRPPARERQVRLLARSGEQNNAAAMLDAIDAAPLSAGERYFARQFRAGRGRQARPQEQLLRLPQPPTGSVEAAALAALTRNGGCGRHLENALPRGLLGLAFWDVIFAPVEAAFVNPYQAAPLDLYWSDFRRSRAELITARLAALREPGAVAQAICTTAQVKRGVNNALVAWHALDAGILQAAVRSVPGHHWVAMFDHMLDDLEQTRTGFPDLALFFGPGRYQFVEVKGPGDEMRREQHLWFEFFAGANIPATLLRVVW